MAGDGRRPATRSLGPVQTPPVSPTRRIRKMARVEPMNVSPTEEGRGVLGHPEGLFECVEGQHRIGIEEIDREVIGAQRGTITRPRSNPVLEARGESPFQSPRSAQGHLSRTQSAIGERNPTVRAITQQQDAMPTEETLGNHQGLLNEAGNWGSLWEVEGSGEPIAQVDRGAQLRLLDALQQLPAPRHARPHGSGQPTRQEMRQPPQEDHQERDVNPQPHWVAREVAGRTPSPQLTQVTTNRRPGMRQEEREDHFRTLTVREEGHEVDAGQATTHSYLPRDLQMNVDRWNTLMQAGGGYEERGVRAPMAPPPSARRINPPPTTQTGPGTISQLFLEPAQQRGTAENRSLTTPGSLVTQAQQGRREWSTEQGQTDRTLAEGRRGLPDCKWRGTCDNCGKEGHKATVCMKRSREDPAATQ